MTEETALYRFYDPGGQLLYVGITLDPGARWKQHRDSKPWWHEVARVEMETHLSRQAALDAERAAIIAEQPKYNVVHNRGRSEARALFAAASHGTTGGKYTYHSLESGYERSDDLYLYPEIHCSSMVDDYYEESGEVQLREWIWYLQRKCPEVNLNAVPIYWSVMPTIETAPFQNFAWMELEREARDFLSFYSWPQDPDGNDLNWSTLPVRMDRFPKFAAELAWLPSPLQATCPLDTILRARDRACNYRFSRRPFA